VKSCHLYFFFIFSLLRIISGNAQQIPNYNDPYNNLGNPNNPNTNPQSQYNTNPQGTLAVDTTSEDTAKVIKEKYGWKHNPIIASVASSILPGLGQAYNGKFWKIPIFWTLMGTFGYLVVNNNTRYQDFRSGYVYLQGKNPDDFKEDIPRIEAISKYNSIYVKYANEILPFDTVANSRAFRILESNRDNARRTRDWMAVFFLLTYVMNIMDASVDAHFAKFDVSDKLSMKVEPSFLSPNGIPQLGLNLNFSFSDTHKKPKIEN